MANTEKDLAGKILSGSGLSAAKLGLRFDRVVVGVLGSLRSFAEAATSESATILITISAPIRSPAKTVGDLKREIDMLRSVEAPRADLSATIQGNHVRMRLIRGSSRTAPGLIGFVHNPTSAPKPLLDLAEQWLRAKD